MNDNIPPKDAEAMAAVAEAMEKATTRGRSMIMALAIGRVSADMGPKELLKTCANIMLPLTRNNSSPSRVLFSDILREVGKHYAISVEVLQSEDRHRGIARPRQVCCYLARRYTNLSYPDIGRRLGGRDHTTTLHGDKKIKEILAAGTDESERLEEDIREIIYRLRTNK